jgi:hypothetical protein
MKRCKLGDVCVITGSKKYPWAIGRICTITGIAPSPHDWVIQIPSQPKPWQAPDQLLRPIRFRDGEDEVLRIAGKPKKETA